MARDELVELLALVRRSDSLDQLYELLPAIRQELVEIQRKRSHFLEDACAAVLKQSFGSHRKWSDSSYSGGELGVAVGGFTDTVRRGVKLCLSFADPLVASLPDRRANEDNEIVRERAVLIAFLLSVLGRPELPLEDNDDDGVESITTKLVDLVLRCGIDLHTIMWTLRFREELDAFRIMVLPRRDESEEDEDRDEDSGSESDDDAWIVHTVASSSGVAAPLEYFLSSSGQEHAFASWSPIGVVRLASLLAVSNTTQPFFPSAISVVSRISNLFVMAGAAQALLQGQGIEVKRQGLLILKSALDRCSPGELAAAESRKQDSEGPTMPSFGRVSLSRRTFNWITPLLELASNAMVSFPDANDRAFALNVFRQLLQVVEVDDRFWLVRHLSLRCPYGNVAAILIDQLRSDTFRVWSASTSAEMASPYSSVYITTLILDLLNVLVDRDLKLHVDLLASVASLIRFLAIRDRANEVGLRNEEIVASVKGALQRLQSRLRSTVAEISSARSTGHSANLHHLLHDENSRFVLVEAALDSTIDLL